MMSSRLLDSATCSGKRCTTSVCRLLVESTPTTCSTQRLAAHATARNWSRESPIWQPSPAKIQDALNGIESVFNMANATADVADFINEFRSSRPAKMILHDAQKLVLQYLQSVMCSSRQPLETTNVFGRYQLRYAVTSDVELVVGPTDDFKNPVHAFGDSRPVRLLITAYLD